MKSILFFFISVSMFFMHGKTFGLSLTPRLGFIWGQAEEIVYNLRYNNPAEDYIYTSLLLWDLKPLVFLGADIDFGSQSYRCNGIFSVLSLKYGLPMRTGILEDFDWVAPNAPHLTHYSRHDVYARGAPWDIFFDVGNFLADISLGYSWGISNKLRLRLYGEFSYIRFSWDSRDGYTKYEQDNWLRNEYSGKAISYTQNWFIIAPGLAVSAAVNEKTGVSLLTSISPVVYGFNRDDHLALGNIRTWLDYPTGGISLKHEIAANYRLNNGVELGISAALRHLGNARGDSYELLSPGVYAGTENLAGGGFRFGEFSIGGKYFF